MMKRELLNLRGLALLLVMLMPMVSAAQPRGETSPGAIRTLPFYLADDPEAKPEGGGAHSQLSLLGPHWGFGYDSLLQRLVQWRESPYVKIDSIGASVQNRALWQLTITSPLPAIKYRKTIFIHARTHPGEVQAWWVTNAIIQFLLSEDDFARILRDRTVFHIVPMYNPDGVELEYDRQNANGIDLEREWDKPQPQPEVVALRKRFMELMASEAPIQIALNLHSAYLCKRYFVYHEASGTSNDYAGMEQRFISNAASFFIGGIEPWGFNRTWDSVTPTNFPESWWWFNHGTRVLALTYEDMNCEEAGKYDSTGYAILRGIGEYLHLPSSGIEQEEGSESERTILGGYPNPFSQETTIRYRIARPSPVTMNLYNQLGELIRTVVDRYHETGEYEVRIDGGGLPDGVYVCQIQTSRGIESTLLTLRK